MRGTSPAGQAKPQAGGEHEERTRHRVRTAVAELGPVTAAALAEVLGLTGPAVRRHLDAMTADGVVEPRDPAPGRSRGRGRPAREYVVAAGGHDGLPAGYDALAVDALAYLARRHGSAAVLDFAEERLQAFEEHLRAAVAEVERAGGGPEQRVAAVAAALADLGYAASARPAGAGTPLAGTQLCQGHCPVHKVAEEFPELCEAEGRVFERVLGTRVQRLATLAHGDHVCTTFVPHQPDDPEDDPAAPRDRTRLPLLPTGTGDEHDDGRITP